MSEQQNAVPRSRRWAVVTGASSGIGLELARVFAWNGFDLLVCAEDAGIDDVTGTLDDTGVAVDAVRVDLASADGVEALVSAIRAAGRPVDVAAINAGVGPAGPFVDTALEEDLRVIWLNVVGIVHLTKALLPNMVARGAGRILFTSSIAATMPGPYYATYAASKAFVQSFAEAVRYEVKDSGVTITALMPGPTDTGFFDRAGMQDTAVDGSPKDDPAEVAQDGFDALMAGKDHVVAGSRKNRAQTAAARVLTDPSRPPPTRG